tara:strand:- start:1814 stop:2281 length:468 start_codon:yes stop_codon:yes gene_type:complete
MKKAVFPGSFDPVTLGHENIIKKALLLFDKIVIGIGENDSKNNLLTIPKRKLLLKKCFKNNPKIEILTYQGLTIDFCKKENIKFIIRGVRDCLDFEYEKKISFMNEDLNNTITTFLIPCSKEFSGISSTLIKSLIKNNGNYSKFIPLEIKNESLS